MNDALALTERSSARAPARSLRRQLALAWGHLLATGVAALFTLPMLWTISSSLKPNYQVREFSPRAQGTRTPFTRVALPPRL